MQMHNSRHAQQSAVRACGSGHSRATPGPTYMKLLRFLSLLNRYQRSIRTTYRHPSHFGLSTSVFRLVLSADTDLHETKLVLQLALLRLGPKLGVSLRLVIEHAFRERTDEGRCGYM
jgi:hypothetical protein